MCLIPAFVLSVFFASCAEAFTAHPKVVARVEGHELSVERLAELMVLGQPLPLTEDVGEELARHWVDVVALAQRLANGDSLWDSSFVRDAMWLNLQQLSIARYRNEIAREMLEVTPLSVDSAYRVGEHRVVAHILKSVPANATTAQRREQRAAAESILTQLQQGGSWEDANLLSDDSIARGMNGNLGILGRGVAVPRFENAAYALDPGSISPVVETEFGYHIIFRPALEDVREQFSAFVGQELRTRFDSTRDSQLMTELNVRVSPQTARKARAIAAAPFESHDTDDAIVTYEGGKITSARFAEYVRLLTHETQQEMAAGSARDLAEFAIGVALQEILAARGDSAGMLVTDSAVVALTDSYRRELAALWTRLGLSPDSLRAGEEPPQKNAARLVDAYLDAAVSRQADLTPIPPFLAARLLEDVRWEIDPRALRASVQMAQRLQAAADDGAAPDTP